ncbi:amidohydrolase family protein [Pantoea sp. AS142]|uniref:amidohydrolase family protein n=1 Tax=Pantoea sp. AS142 TaxID=3081292 RepID=UPI00301A18FE
MCGTYWVKLDQHGIEFFAHTRAGVAHCPCSNMRLVSGIAPLRHMCDAGVHVGMGEDGLASSGCSDMMAEVCQVLE